MERLAFLCDKGLVGRRDRVKAMHYFKWANEDGVLTARNDLRLLKFERRSDVEEEDDAVHHYMHTINHLGNGVFG